MQRKIRRATAETRGKKPWALRWARGKSDPVRRIVEIPTRTATTRAPATAETAAETGAEKPVPSLGILGMITAESLHSKSSVKNKYAFLSFVAQY